MYEKKCVITLDLGTSSFKCGNVTPEGRIFHVDAEKFDVFHNGCIYETEFETAFDRTLILLQKAVRSVSTEHYNIDAILITSQAQTFAPVDDQFNPLSPALVWLDARAEKESEELNQKLERFPERAGFIKVMPELYISKLLWLRRNKPDIFNKARYFPLINEYIAYRLTNHFYTDITNFGMSGMLDIRTGRLNAQVLNTLGLSNEDFPEIHPPACVSYPVAVEVRKRIGLEPGAGVYLCGNDQSASSAGAGLKNKGDISVNFGTAMVVYALMDKPPIPDEITQIAGIGPMGGYFLLSFEDVGNIIEEVKCELFPDMSYDDFFSRYKDRISEKYSSFLKDGKVDYSIFPSNDTVAATVIDYYVRRFLYHISVIEKAVLPRNIYVGGGLAQSRVWIEIIRKRCKYRVNCVNTKEAGLIGAYVIYRHNLISERRN